VADPIARLRRLDAFRSRLAAMHRRVGLVFFMPATRDRFRQRLYRKWLLVGQQRAMLMASIQASPELRRRLHEEARQAASMVSPKTYTNGRTQERTR
jgi:hypothetical protein